MMNNSLNYQPFIIWFAKHKKPHHQQQQQQEEEESRSSSMDCSKTSDFLMDRENGFVCEFPSLEDAKKVLSESGYILTIFNFCRDMNGEHSEFHCRFSSSQPDGKILTCEEKIKEKIHVSNVNNIIVLKLDRGLLKNYNPKEYSKNSGYKKTWKIQNIHIKAVVLIARGASEKAKQLLGDPKNIVITTLFAHYLGLTIKVY